MVDVSRMKPFHVPARKSVLPCGMRVLTSTMPHVRSVSVGVWVGVGSRHESDAEAGASHFLEHLLFKGSANLSARRISEDIEGAGGQVNAFTSEEATCCYAAVPADRLSTAIDVMAEMFLRAACRRSDIERERGVILDELALYRDQPQAMADEALDKSLWPRHPLGRPVPGMPHSVRSLTRGQLLAFRARHYLASSTVVTVAGYLSHDEVVRLVRKAFAGMRQSVAPEVRSAGEAGRIRRLSVHPRKIEQTHIALGFRTSGYRDPNRYAMRLLDVVLGENTSSRLFQRIREASGLAYAVQSGTVHFSDTGALVINASTDAADEGRVLRAIVRECRRLAGELIGKAEMKRAKDYVIGQARMGLESTVQRMMWLGEQTLMYGHMVEPFVHEDRLSAVTAAEVRDLARTLFVADHAALAVAGPGADRRKDNYLAALGRLG